MQLTTRGRYGVMAMVELAALAAGNGHAAPVGLADIAARQQLSLCYLEQLFGGLRRAGLVASVRGPGGGYRLARPAEQVTIAEVLAAVDEPIRVTRCDGATPGCMAGQGDEAPGDHRARCRTHDLWEALGHHLHSFLSAVTLADVLAGEFCGFAIARRPTEAVA
jgi:Rrf2 family iron-sulfur cluster assembly transcriptional regulator